MTASRRLGRADSLEDEDGRELVPVPLRFYALFIVPIVAVMLWALFLK